MRTAASFTPVRCEQGCLLWDRSQPLPSVDEVADAIAEAQANASELGARDEFTLRLVIDAHEQVRKSLARYLANNLDHYPAARKVLQDIMNDTQTNRQLRNYLVKNLFSRKTSSRRSLNGK